MAQENLKNHLFKIFTFIILCVLTLACSNISAFSQSIADKQAVLSVGQVTITKYEFEKNLVTFKSDFIRRNNFNPGPSDIKKWIQSYIDRTYFLADAYKKGFDTLSIVNRMVASMAHLIIAQPGGLLSQKMATEKLSSITNQTNKVLQFASEKVTVEYLKFKNYEQAINSVGAFGLKTHKEFDTAVSKNLKTHLAIFKVDTLKWPFSLFGNETDLIAGFKPNQVTPLFALSDGYYLMYIRDVQTLPKSEVSNIKKQITALLAIKADLKAREQYQKAVEEKAQIKINSETLLQLQKYMRNDGPLHEFNKASLSGRLKAKIMSYTENNKSITVSVDQFINYYNYLTIKTEIKDSDDLVYYIKSMVFDDYSYKKAQDYGLTKDDKFLLNKKNYKHAVIYHLYEKEELAKGITVSDEEVKKRYDSCKSTFTQASDVTISIYHFKDRNSALLGIFKIRKGDNDITNLPGLENVEMGKNLSYKSNLLPDSIKWQIFDLKKNQVSRPILINKKYMIVVKESKSGSRIRSLDEVKGLIVKELRDEKLRKNKARSLSRIKSFYPIRNRIDYQQYLTVSR